MRRLVAVVLAHALAVSTAVASSLHVHQYADHDHPEHHHGPAAHSHAIERAHHDAHDTELDRSGGHGQPTLRPQSCDPGRHAIRFAAGTVCQSSTPVVLAEPLTTGVRVPAPAGRRFPRVLDVRAHGPPGLARIPARAPPLTLLPSN